MKQKESKVLTGTVVSAKSANTVVVVVERTVKHKIYEKITRTTKKYAVHNPSNVACPVGSEVKFKECRPISKTKKWVLV